MCIKLVDVTHALSRPDPSQSIVIDVDGLAVANSHVIKIISPGDTTETNRGRVNTIVGPGSAKILVGNATIRGVTLC